MKKYNGKSIFKGIAIGDILFYQKEKQQVKRQRVEDVAKEKAVSDGKSKSIRTIEAVV